MSEVPLRSAFVVLGALSANYVIAHFFRASNAVIAPDLMRDLALSSEQMGVLTGAFFVSAALAQLPIGMMLDRVGTRITVPGLVVFAVAGSLIFAAANGFAALTVGRVLIGAGSSSVVMGALVVCTRWFAPQHFATMAGALIALGNLGNLLATTPLAAVAETVGWRGAFVVMAVVAAAAAILGYAVIRDAPPGHPYYQRKSESLAAVIRGVGEVAMNPRLPAMIPINFVSYGCMLTILGLWGGPYLHDVHGLGPVARGNVLAIMAIALILGYLAFGPLDRAFDTRKGVVLCGGFVSVSALALLAILREPPVWQVTALFAALAGSNGFGVVAFAHGRAIFPDRLVGRGITMLALISMAGIAFMQMIGGLILGAFAGADGLVSAEGYRLMFAAISAMVAAALLVYLRVEDVKPSQEMALKSG